MLCYMIAVLTLTELIWWSYFVQNCTSQERKLAHSKRKVEAISFSEKSRYLTLVQLTVYGAVSAVLSAIPVLWYDDCWAPLVWRNTCVLSKWDDSLMWHYIQTQETLCSPFLSGWKIYRHVIDECVYIFLFHSSTRESLASNTSSIVESNRRQNPALSPAHGGAGPTFNFRATADPPTSDAEKLQKPGNCLQASVTSVW